MTREKHAVLQNPELTAMDEATRTLVALVEAVDQRDGHLAGHSQRLACLSLNLGIALGLDDESLHTLYRGGYLHDIGKIGVPDSILLKPGRLTAEEWEIMKSHPAQGAEICRHLQFLAPVLPLIRHHHERWDGSGYPDQLAGEQIPVLARVLQVADIYDALTNPRPYKPAFSAEKALHTLQSECDRGWRDPAIVRAFFRLQPGMNESSGSLENLRQVVESGWDGTNGRISFRPLPPLPAAGFPAEAEGRWHTE